MQNSEDDNEQATIAISYSRMMARQLNLQEKDLWMLLRGTRLSTAELLDDNTLLFKQQQLQIMANAITLSADPGFGLHIGQALTPPTHGPLGFLANITPNLLTAITDFQNFLPARVSFTHLKTAYEAQYFVCVFDIELSTDDPLYRCVLECFVLSLYSLISSVLGYPFTQGKLFCSYPKPKYHKQYKQFIKGPITFRSKQSKLLIPRALLLTPNVSANHIEYEFALKQCQNMLGRLDKNHLNTSNKVKRHLLSSPPGKLSEQATANLLFISKRTLARRLSKEGTSFSELRDDILKTLASDYLRDTKLSVESIAIMLNYHDSSSFRRAFKRWLHKTPQQYRLDILAAH